MLKSKYKVGDLASRYMQRAGVHSWYTAASGTANATISFTQAMTLDASGNLGINTSTIGSKLQVFGNAAIGYSASTAAPTNGLVVAGNVGIGSTTINAALQVTGASGTGFFTAQRLDNSTNNAYQSWSFGGTVAGSVAGFVNANILEAVPFSTGNFVISAFSNNLVFMTNNRNERMQITSGGQITLTTGANVSAIAQTGYSLTGANAQSLLDLAGTWNTTGNPTAIKLNITNTASGATSNLMDLQVGGVSKFKVDKAGSVTTAGFGSTTAQPWKLGQLVTATVTGVNLTGYITIEVNGTQYNLALANLA